MVSLESFVSLNLSIKLNSETCPDWNNILRKMIYSSKLRADHPDQLLVNPRESYFKNYVQQFFFEDHKRTRSICKFGIVNHCETYVRFDVMKKMEK